MTKYIRLGFDFDMPQLFSQIVGLRNTETLLDVVFHQEIHLGGFCLAQRKRVYDFTSLDENQRVDFYETY